MNMDKQDLLRAAKAVRAREAAQYINSMTELQMEQLIRSSPLWAAIKDAPGPHEPLSEHHLETFIRTCQIAQALGIGSSGQTNIE